MSGGTVYVYIACHVRNNGIVGPVKIGITSSLDKRLAQIQTGNPRPVTLAFSFSMPDRDMASDVEHAFHSVLSDRRMTGEWFDLEPAHALRLMCENVDAALAHWLSDSGELRAGAVRLTGLEAARELLRGATLN